MIQLTAISDAVSCAATVPLMSLSEIVIISGIAAVKESLKTFARNVAYRTNIKEIGKTYESFMEMKRDLLQSQEKGLEVSIDENSIGINEQEQETVF